MTQPQTISVFYSASGSPALGLSPTIRIIDLSDNSVVVNDVVMSEVGNGFYKYIFSTYDPDKDYVFRADGGSGLAETERYATGGNENYVDDIWDASVSNHQVVGSLAAELRASHADFGSAFGVSNRVLTKEEADTFARMVWEVMLDNKKSAKDVLLSRSDFNSITDKVKLEKELEIPEIDMSSIEAKLDILLAKPEDKIDQRPDLLLVEIRKVMQWLQNKQPDIIEKVFEKEKIASVDINFDWDKLEEIKDSIISSEPVNQEKISQMISDMNEKNQNELRKMILALMQHVSNTKYDILKNNIKRR